MKISEYIKERVLVTDGAMGTFFDQIEKEHYLCSEEANLVNPDLISQIHRAYIDSGAQLIRTNTFSANASIIKALQGKYPYLFRNLTIADLVVAGYEIAKKVSDEAARQGKEVYVAADIGPVLEENEADEEEILQEYYAMIDGFLSAGADIFVFETFPDEKYVLPMARYVRSQKENVYIIAQFSFVPTGYSRTSFHYQSVLQKAAKSGLLDAVGFNCGIGAAHMKRFIENLFESGSLPEQVALTALPNCGYPQIVRGKAVYSDSVDYFSQTVLEIVELGAAIVGGCCGTTPEYIRHISGLVEDRALGRKRIHPHKKCDPKERKQEGERKQIENKFKEKLDAGRQVIAVELDPPFDHQIEKIVAAAKELKHTKADIITLADSPLARSRADSILMAAKLKHEFGIDVMPHLSCRDRNRIAVRSNILGAHINDIRNMLFVTGDPVDKEARSFTKSVFEFNSIRLMDFVKGMNEEHFFDDPIIYGGAINQNGVNIDGIADRIKKKMEAGCSYFLTQPVYSKESLDIIAQLKEKTGAKILIGIMPLVSYRNALFIKNEMPGIHVPDEILSAYPEEGTREEWEETAIRISLSVMEMGRDVGAGYYMMTPFNRVSLIRRILEAFEG